MKSSLRRKPPLPVPTISPRRLRPPRRSLRSDTPCRTPPATQLTHRQQRVLDESEHCPSYRRIELELHRLARRVEEEFGRSYADSRTPLASQLSQLKRKNPLLFERGRRYQEYAAKRTDRLRKRSRRRSAGTTATSTAKTVQAIGGVDLGVVVGSEMAKKRTTNRCDSGRKSMPVEFSAGRRPPSPSSTYGLRSSTYNLRSSVRGSKETTPSSSKTPLPPLYSGQKRTPATRSRNFI